MMGKVTKLISQGFASEDFEVYSTPPERLIVLITDNHNHLLRSEDSLEAGTMVFKLEFLAPIVHIWCLKNLKGSLMARPGIGSCMLAFELGEDAALFKLFWL